MNGDPDGCYDAENVVLDELGHVLGLDHHVNYADDSDYADAVVQTYTHAKPRVGWHAHVFGRCDVATLQQEYDVADLDDALQHLPGRPDPDDARGDAHQRGRRLQGHVHGDPDAAPATDSCRTTRCPGGSSSSSGAAEPPGRMS